jgi:hypothetical protein
MTIDKNKTIELKESERYDFMEMFHEWKFKQKLVYPS